MIYKKTQTTYTSRSGANAKMSLIGAVQIIQDSICEYFETLGIDEIRMKTNFNTIWVFTRNSVELVRPLSWDEDFEVTCAITDKTPAKLVVDTTLTDTSGNTVVQSKTEICLVDLTTLRLKKIDSTLLGENYELSPALTDISFDRPEVKNGLNVVSSTIVPSTAIDYCGHVNNVEYIRFILNTYSAESLRRDVKRFDISYVAQSLENDSLNILKATECGADFFEIRSKDKVITRSRLVFNNQDI